MNAAFEKLEADLSWGPIFFFDSPKATFSDLNWLSASLQSKHAWSIAYVNIACYWCN